MRDGWEIKPSFFLGEGEWHIIDPTGGIYFVFQTGAPTSL